MKATRWKCVCAYDGTTFAGWQSQSGGTAVQDVIEERLSEILKASVRIHGSGRTDAGVHARGQVFHFDAIWPHGSAAMLAALRGGLPISIQVKSAKKVSDDFHSRFQTKGKRYAYFIHLGDADPFTRPYRWCVFRPLDVNAMEQAAKVLCGRHDFRAFTALNGPAKENTMRNLRVLEVKKRGNEVRITAEGEGFLYKMVRSLAGVLVAVGEGRLEVEKVSKILESRRRTALVPTAPPHGLCLMNVFY